MADILFNTSGTAVSTTGFREEYPQFFRLILPTTEDPLVVDIAEPIGWSEAPETLDRSERWHGFNYEVLGETKLRFNAECGRDHIIAAYNTYGFDVQIIFQYGTTHEGGDIVEYEGVLDLLTKSDDGTFFACSIEKKTLHKKIEPRFDTKLDLYATTTLDDVSMGSITPTNIVLHSKAFQETFLNEFTDITRETEGLFKGDGDIYIFPEATNPSISDIKDFVPKPFSATNESPFEVAGGAYMWKAQSGGDYRFQINWSFTGVVDLIKKTISLGELSITSRQTRAFLVIERDKIRTSYQIGTTSFLGKGALTSFLVSFSGSLDQTITIEAGDKIYIYGEVKYTYKGVNELKQTNYTFTNTNVYIRVDGKSESDKSGVNGLTTYNALRRALWQIANVDCLNSDFFNTGCGSKYLITNGFSLRRFANKNPIISTKELLESLDAIFFIGYEYNTSVGGQVIKIKKAEDFYAGGEIHSFDSCFDYKSDIASQYIYSSVDVGYSKFMEEGLSFLDEPNTKHEYQLAIEGHENKLQIMSALISSGYALEDTRREQFAQSPKDSTRYDDDCFIIAYAAQGTQTASASVVFFKLYSIQFISFAIADLPAFFAVGIVITVSDTVSNNTTFTIRAIQLYVDSITKVETYRVMVSGAMVAEATVTATFSSSAVAGAAERDEAFDTVENVISPETSYNLRISPKRMLYNRSKWLISTLYYKSSSSVVKNTFFKMNGDLTTQFKESETCLLGDVNRSVIVEKNSVQKGSFGYGLPLFRPEWISFGVYTDRATWNKIRKALRGAQGSGLDYGYLTISDPNGNSVSGYPFKVSRNGFSGKTLVKMLRKA